MLHKSKSLSDGGIDHPLRVFELSCDLFVANSDKNLLEVHIANWVTLNAEFLLFTINLSENFSKMCCHIVTKLVDNLACFVSLEWDGLIHVNKGLSAYFWISTLFKLFYDHQLVASDTVPTVLVALVKALQVVNQVLVWNSRLLGRLNLEVEVLAKLLLEEASRATDF